LDKHVPAEGFPVPALKEYWAQYRTWVGVILDNLLEVQDKELGVFPFPDLRGVHPRFGPHIERMLAQNPNILRGNWVVKDNSRPELGNGDGGGQFDNGLTGRAVVEGYAHLKDKRYLESARSAAEWAIRQSVVPNWNYNAFSVHLLARLYRENTEKRYLETALKKLRLGVFPGQMENGRWVDPHNARRSYHCIMLNAILETYQAMPAGYPEKDEVFHHLYIGIENLVTEILKCGVSAFDFPLTALCTFDELAEKNQQVMRIRGDIRKAINRIANLVFDSKFIRFNSIPYPGPSDLEAIATYLKWRTEKGE